MLRREGLLVGLGGFLSYSRSDVQAFLDNPWINARQADVDENASIVGADCCAHCVDAVLIRTGSVANSIVRRATSIVQLLQGSGGGRTRAEWSQSAH